MQKYHVANCTGAVNNSTISGPSARDTARVDSSSFTNFSPNPRRSSQLTPYKQKCDKDPLNSRLGPPDFHPQTPNCPEETLTREYVQTGYRETVEGIEENREIALTQVAAFTKPNILKCKEAIRKRLRAINESRAQKRKAGQVYGVPISGLDLTKPGVFPEQRPCGEDSRKKWIEALSQHHKRLHSLADHVPHGYRKKSLFEVLVKNNVPLLRATWFIKVTYLNQVRSGSASISSGTPDKSQLSRTELYTKDVIDYLHNLLDEILSKNTNCTSISQGRDRSPQVIYEGEERSLHFKWWYMVRIVHWHHSEGLLLPSHIIEWVLNQMQEKELVEVMQLLLPIIYGVIEVLALSQTYVRSLVGISLRFIREPSLGGSDLVDNSRRAYTTSTLIEMLRYLILAVPDTFVALDCFPLPRCVVSDVVSDGNFLLKEKKVCPNGSSDKVDHIVSFIQKRADNLAKAAGSRYSCPSVAKAVQILDKALLNGDLRGAYKSIFQDISDGAFYENWLTDVCPCLRASLKFLGTVSLPLISSVFFLCEWATCDFRDFRTSRPHGLKFSGRKDFSEVYLAIQVLKLKMGDIQIQHRSKKGVLDFPDVFQSPGPLHDILVCWIDQHEFCRGEGFKRIQLLIMELTRLGLFYPQAYVRQLMVSGIMEQSGRLERRQRHLRVLKQLPESYTRNALEEAQIAENKFISDAMNVYSNERRLLLRGLLSSQLKSTNSANILSRRSLQTLSNSCSSTKKVKNDSELKELKSAISILLQFPSSSFPSIDSGLDESQGSVKRHIGSDSNCNRMDNIAEGATMTPGCEECKRVMKRQKLSEERSSFLQVLPPNSSEDEESWWVKKGVNSVDPSKVDPPLIKPPKQTSRGRQKVVRKTQSLAQLAAARIEGSQGASTSHICDSKVTCPHHKTGIQCEASKSTGVSKANTNSNRDIVSIGKALKQLRLSEQRAITGWLLSVVRQLVEETEKSTVSKVAQFSRPLNSIEDRSINMWRIGEDELSAVLYLMDISNDLVSAVKFLIWMLPKTLMSPNSTIHGGRNMLMLPRNVESHVCDVGEAFLLSSLRRYENILVATDLIPEALSATMRRAAAVMASNGRVSNSSSLLYARYLLKKYSNLFSVKEWEKNFKATSDEVSSGKRLLSELESGRSLEGEIGFSLGLSAGIEDLDDFLRQKITSGRISRTGVSMRDIVQRHVDDAFHYFYGKDRKLFVSGPQKFPAIEKWDDGFQMAQKIIISLMDCMRQTGGAAQEGDPSLVSSAISAIVCNVGPAVAKIPDFTAGNNNYPNIPLNIARRILKIHLTCLCLLKEALGERQSRVFEIALATEASSALSGTYPNLNISNEILNSQSKSNSGRATKVSAAVSSLVIGAVLHGVVTLERMVTVLRLKEGMDLNQFLKSTRSNSNGSSRQNNSLEMYVYWFRVLIGNCRTISDGLIVDLLGEQSIVALSRYQRNLPLNLVFPPAYSIFAFVIRRPFILKTNIAAREDIHQLYQSLTSAISDAIKHLPFRHVCLRDTQGLYDLVASDSSDSEFAAMVEFTGPDLHLKTMACVPLRARLFLNAIIDCKLPNSLFAQDDGNNRVVLSESENEIKLLDKLVQVLDSLQPAKFHWQWVELRLLLHEQALIEKIETHDMPIAEAIRSLSPLHGKSALSENENNFIEIILTRLLVRPDAASLYAELVHLFGKSMEDSMLLQAKWFLGGHDVLFGRKSIKQRLNIIAEGKGLSTKAQFWKPWGWSYSSTGKRKFEAASIEEGEVVEEKNGKDPWASHMSDSEAISPYQQHVTERAFIKLVLPCIDQGSDESRNTFASDLIKQMSNIEQQINAVTRGVSKQAGTVPSGIDAPSNKTTSRKGMRGGSPGLVRRQAGATVDSGPPTPSALRTSMSLRLQFLLRLLPLICADREPSVRNMRHSLAIVILHLLGSRVVNEGADLYFNPMPSSSNKDLKNESEMEVNASVSLDLSLESLFDRLLLVFHGLLSSCQPSWLKSKQPSPRSNSEVNKDFSGVDREVAETLQHELEVMQLSDAIRWRVQAAMPMLLPSARFSISCQPSPVSISSLVSLQPSAANSLFYPPANSIPLQRHSSALSRTTKTTKQSPAQQENYEMEIDPWTLLEDGAGSGPSSSNSAVMGGGDSANLKASSWLRGAVRVRKTDLTYIGSVDDDS